MLHLLDTASPLELAWTWMALFGFGLGARLWYFVWRSRRRLRQRGINGVRMRVNRIRQRNQTTRCLTFGGFALLGIVRMFVPEPLRPSVQMADVLGQVILVGIQARMLWDVILESLDRQTALGAIIRQAFGVGSE